MSVNGTASLSATELKLLLPATDDGPVILTEINPENLLTDQLSKLHPMNFAAGVGASSGGVGVAGSFIVNVINQTTHAYVGSGAQVNTRVGTAGYPTANADESVTVSATESMTLEDWAGALGVGNNVGVGAALAVDIVGEDVQAFIASSATVDAAQDVIVTSSTNGSFQSITAAAGLGKSTAIAGAASIEILSPTTDAFIDQGATVNARGNLLVQASHEATIDTIAGQIGLGGNASAGAAVSTIVDTVNTNAFIGANDLITAGGPRERSRP